MFGRNTKLSFFLSLGAWLRHILKRDGKGTEKWGVGHGELDKGVLSLKTEGVKGGIQEGTNRALKKLKRQWYWGGIRRTAL